MSHGQVLDAGDRDLGRSVVPSGFADSAVAQAEANHRIANNLALLASAVSMRTSEVRKRKGPISGDEAAEILAEVGTRIAMIGQVHRALSHKPENERLDLADHLAELCETLIEALAPEGSIELEWHGAEACVVSADDVVDIGLIVTEAVTNSLKYAHPSGVRGRLAAGCRKTDDGAVLVEIEDDGVGLPEEFDFATDGGIGSRTIRVLSKQIGADVRYESLAIGTRFTLRLSSA